MQPEPIRVVDLDAKGEPTKIEWLPANEVELPGDCVIVLNPGVPPLHSKEFGPWLAKRNRELNGENMTGRTVG